MRSRRRAASAMRLTMDKPSPLPRTAAGAWRRDRSGRTRARGPRSGMPGPESRTLESRRDRRRICRADTSTLPVRRRVAQRVVDQVRHQVRSASASPRTVDARRSAFRPRSMLFAAARGARSAIDLARERGQVDRRLRARRRRRALRAPASAAARRAAWRDRVPPFRSASAARALGVGRRALGELRLQVHGGQRRAQFVRGIGDERALRVERVTEAPEQIR